MIRSALVTKPDRRVVVSGVGTTVSVMSPQLAGFTVVMTARLSFRTHVSSKSEAQMYGTPPKIFPSSTGAFWSPDSVEKLPPFIGYSADEMMLYAHWKPVPGSVAFT